jgi:hypothetical protein
LEKAATAIIEATFELAVTTVEATTTKLKLRCNNYLCYIKAKTYLADNSDATTTTNSTALLLTRSAVATMALVVVVYVSVVV